MKRTNDLSLKTTLLTMALILTSFIYSTHAADIPKTLGTVTGEDGSVWERVNAPGFGNRANLAITALCPFQGSLYALTRNDETGFEIWRTEGDSWTQVTAPGFTDSPYHSLMTNIWGDMIEFQDRLYVVVASGSQGATRYSSIGLELWRFDGTTWEPIISYAKDTDESATISSINGCSKNDGATTAEFTVSGKNWTADQWAGGIVRMTSGDGTGRVFYIISNTADTLTVQQNEEARTQDDEGKETEFTVCAGQQQDTEPTTPAIVIGTVSEGDSFDICIGEDENGFGDPWNKSVVDFEIFNGELYASVGLHYEKGTRIWKTADGTNWIPDSDYSFGLYHGFDPEGNETGMCLINGLEDRNGSPVSSSANNFGKSSIDGTETLYIGATGTSACNGRGARVLKLEDGQWNFIVDYFVDDNDEGTNENGFGDAESFFSSNFQAWSFAEYDDKLFCGIIRVQGTRIMYTETGSSEDGAWLYASGGDAAHPDGFDGVSDFAGYGANIGCELYSDNTSLYAGTIVNNKSPSFFPPTLDGADLWRATGPAEALVWSRITGDGFGDTTIMAFESYVSYNDDLYICGSNVAPRNFPETAESGALGATIYRLKSLPPFTGIASFTATPGRRQVTLNWTADNETGCSGYNLYRSCSEKYNKEYIKINDALIQSGNTSYTFTDEKLWFNWAYSYKLECVGTDDSISTVGPIGATTEALFPGN